MKRIKKIGHHQVKNRILWMIQPQQPRIKNIKIQRSFCSIFVILINLSFDSEVSVFCLIDWFRANVGLPNLFFMKKCYLPLITPQLSSHLMQKLFKDSQILSTACTSFMEDPMWVKWHSSSQQEKMIYIIITYTCLITIALTN